MKGLLLIPFLAISLNLNKGDFMKKELEIKANEEVTQKMEIKEGHKTYELELNEILERKDITKKELEKVTETKTYIVKTNDKEKILADYKELEYKNDKGTGTLRAEKIGSIKENNYNEKYWETTESINRSIETTTDKIDTIPKENLVYEENGKKYEMTSAELTPISFIDNKPVRWRADGTWTAIIPHYEKTPIEWKVEIEYTGEINYDEKIGENVVAEYKVVKVNRDIQWEKIIPSFGTAIVVIVGLLLRTNIIIKSNNKKLKGYRKRAKDKIELNLTKELKISNDLEVIIKKSLAKKLNNTQLVVKNNNDVIYDTILNSSEESIKIKIRV